MQDFESHFVHEGVTIEDEVFIGHGVTFTNDTYPRATTDGQLQTESDWHVETTLIKKGASIGSGATVLSKVPVGENGDRGRRECSDQERTAQHDSRRKSGPPVRFRGCDKSAIK